MKPTLKQQVADAFSRVSAAATLIYQNPLYTREEADEIWGIFRLMVAGGKHHPSTLSGQLDFMRPALDIINSKQQQS
ncbi:MAG: hypothetical protein LIO91_03710 [Bacteroidales bacterium]|nr:hypothetical protein [Bacteroidales bacterium]